MRPTLPAFDSTDGICLDANLSSYFFLGALVFSNGTHLSNCQFMRAAALAAIGSSMFYFVGMIIRGRIPSKIVQAIVGGISIVMACLHSLRTRSNKCREDESRNAEQLAFVFLPKKDTGSLKAPLLAIAERWFLLFSARAEYMTEIGHHIAAFISVNIGPNGSPIIAPINRNAVILHHAPPESRYGILA